MKLRIRSEVFIFKEGKVLANLAKGYVCFPGGGIDPHEHPVDAAKRECLEEADRVLIGCTPAHPPTVQLWSEAFKKSKADWTADFTGGFTHWMTGSSSRLPYHPDPRMRHADYEPGFAWYDPQELVEKLAHEMTGEWVDDVKVRQEVLKAHIGMHKVALFPLLSAIPSE